MCGIVGVASVEAIGKREWLRTGRDAMCHRGPDGAGEWWSADGRVGFAHRRLAIIDLSAGGHQPMSDGTGDLHITFNGEIYNYRELRQELAARGHRFRTESDTEVILEAYREWGDACLERLNGMFALAVYDQPRERLLLARDRAGEKPLFYIADRRGIRFASELKALLADPAIDRRIDRDALDCYLAMGFIPGERCIIAGVHKLPPAHALVFDLRTGAAAARRYWELPRYEGAPAGEESDAALLDELETLLEDAVKRQMVADVPVGVLLSGGVDSSLITAMATRATPTVKTFTVRFPGFSGYDETEHARLIARHFGTQHIELEAGNSTVELLPMLARQFDEPMADSSMVPTYMVSRLIREHCTVALGGDGGDELFGGYPHYSRMRWMEQRLGWIPRRMRAAVASAHRALPVGFKGRNWLSGLGTDFVRHVPDVTGHFDRDARRRLHGRDRSWRAAAESIGHGRVPAATDLVDRATRSDFENYLAEDILVKVDRASMLSSLEVRAPLLDHRVIEFAFGRVPPRLKATATTRKVLLKMLAARVLPPAFDRHRKQGFSLPLDAWLQDGAWRTFFRDVLLAADGGLFDPRAVQQLLAGQARGRANSERLFSLVMLELWRREYDVSL